MAKRRKTKPDENVVIMANTPDRDKRGDDDLWERYRDDIEGMLKRAADAVSEGPFTLRFFDGEKLLKTSQATELDPHVIYEQYVEPCLQASQFVTAIEVEDAQGHKVPAKLNPAIRPS